MELYRQSPYYNPTNDVPLWQMNLIIAAVMATLVLVALVIDLRQRKAGEKQQQAQTD